MWQAIKQYNGASLVLERTDHILTDTDQNTVYFWSSDPIDVVKANYEKTGLSFVAGNAQNEWWIATYNKNEPAQTLPTISSTEPAITHRVLCHLNVLVNSYYYSLDATENARLEPVKKQEFGCISVVIVKANQPNLCTLLPVFPGNRGFHQYGTVTPYENCSRFPKDGTLIIFNYYLEGM